MDQTSKSAAVAAPEAAPLGTRGTVIADPLGQWGAALSSYHIGDITGILGLVLTFVSTLAAVSAKRAADEARKAAIYRRDSSEIIAKLAELARRLRDLRILYATGDWGGVDTGRDLAAQLVVELMVMEKSDETLFENVLKFLREPQPEPSQMKDETRRQKLQRSWALQMARFADGVDSIKHVKVKHGN